MHIRIRTPKGFTGASVSILVGPRSLEKPSPQLQSLLDEEQDAFIAYQKYLNKGIPPSHEKSSLFDAAVYMPRFSKTLFPRVIIEFFDFKFKLVFTSQNGIARWSWVDSFPLGPTGTKRHSFFAGKGEMVPVTLRSLRIIEAVMTVYGSPPAFHTELDDFLGDGHDHWVINVWLRISLEEDRSADTSFTTLTSCGTTEVLKLFNTMCGIKADERFCVMPLKWEEGKLVKGVAYSYQTATSSKSTIGEMGWPKTVWLWPCRVPNNLENDTGYWKNEDLTGFDPPAEEEDSSEDSSDDSLDTSPDDLIRIDSSGGDGPMIKRDTVIKFLNLLKEASRIELDNNPGPDHSEDPTDIPESDSLECPIKSQMSDSMSSPMELLDDEPDRTMR